METADWNEMALIAKAWVKEAGLLIRESFSRTIKVAYKTDASDLVTEMDQAIEQFFASKIKTHYPEHKMLGEEGFGDEVTQLNGIVWLVDPIDGTMNFVHMQKHFAISVGIYFNGVGMVGIIYDVEGDEIFYAIKGQGAYCNGEKLQELAPVPVEKAVMSVNASWAVNERKIKKGLLTPLIRDLRGTRAFGSAAIEMAYVASGRIDGYLTLRLSPWDFAAGKIIIEEVGGKVSTMTGTPLQMLTENTVFVAKPGLHDVVIADYLAKDWQ